MTSQVRFATADEIRHLPAEEQVKRGESDFRYFCASCHGQDASGGGPVAGELKTTPPSLRQIAKRHGGTFDPVQITKIIDGREMPRAHGTREMPIWGCLFPLVAETMGVLAADPEHIEKHSQEHISALVAYLKSIQEE